MTSDRGLAGSFNANLLKRAEDAASPGPRRAGSSPCSTLTGKKAIGYFRFRGVPRRGVVVGLLRGAALRRRRGDRGAADRGLRRAPDRRAPHRLHGLPLGVHVPRHGQAVPADRAGGDRGRPAGRAEPRVPLRAGAGRDPGRPAAAVRRHEDLLRAARVGRLGERRPAAGDGGRDRQRGRAHQGAHPAGEPRPPGRDHDGDHGDRGRGRGPGPAQRGSETMADDGRSRTDGSSG